jgi:hypothetical protein
MRNLGVKLIAATRQTDTAVMDNEDIIRLSQAEWVPISAFAPDQMWEFKLISRSSIWVRIGRSMCESEQQVCGRSRYA